jgi:hypothetical protein
MLRLKHVLNVTRSIRVWDAINLLHIVATDIALCPNVRDLGNNLDRYQRGNRGSPTFAIRRDTIHRSRCGPSDPRGILGKIHSTVPA